MIELVHRNIDFEKDRDYVLECHCRVNYACDTPWMRKLPYEDYRRQWFGLNSQITGFYWALQTTAQDGRALAEILDLKDGGRAGYLWAVFEKDNESGFAFAELREIYIEPELRRQGLSAQAYAYVEAWARTQGAAVLRAGTGCENAASIAMHEQMGFYTYRLEFEKEL